MFSKEILDLLKQVLKSWEVLAVTVGLVLYIFIVKYVSRSHYRRRVKREKKIKIKKAEPIIKDDDDDGGHIEDSNDELGLEEA